MQSLNRLDPLAPLEDARVTAGRLTLRLLMGLAMVLAGPWGPASALQVRSVLELGKGQGGFSGTGGDFDESERWGMAVARIDDLDGDGIDDLAVGKADDLVSGCPDCCGEIWILFLNADGSVRAEQSISAVHGGSGNGNWPPPPGGPQLRPNDQMGLSLAYLGLIGGKPALAAGAPFDDDGNNGIYGPNSNVGAIWILFLNPDGTVDSFSKISGLTYPGFAGGLDDFDHLGYALAALQAPDGSGLFALAAGAPGDNNDISPFYQGSTYILFLDGTGAVTQHLRICDGEGGFTGFLQGRGRMGETLAALDDLDGNGVPDLAIGTSFCFYKGIPPAENLWICFLDSTGSVIAQHELSEEAGELSGPIHANCESVTPNRSLAMSWLGDWDGDGYGELAVGTPRDPEGAPTSPIPVPSLVVPKGAIHLLSLDSTGHVVAQRKLSQAQGLCTYFGDGQRVGMSLASLGDLDGAGPGELTLAAGAPSNIIGTEYGDGVWMIQLDTDPPDLRADVEQVSMTSGGTQRLCLDAGVARAGQIYFLLGSMSGSQPGVNFGGMTLPLNLDPYFRITLNHPNQPPLMSSLGTLNEWGQAMASITPPSIPALAGIQLHHAYLLFSQPMTSGGGEPQGVRPVILEHASQAVSLDLVP